MDNALVTVIIPVYNVEKYLNKCLESVISQSYGNLQILLVDDGSTDKSGQLCDQLKETDKRIEVIHKENGGLGSAKNAGMEKADGRYMAFVDSDDWIDADHIRQMVDSMESTGADIVITGYKKCKNEQGPFKKIPLIKSGCYDDVLEEVLLPMISVDETVPDDKFLPVGTPFKLYKTEIIKENGLLFANERECVSEDFFFNIDYLRRCARASIIEEYGYNYRYNGESISRKYNPSLTERTFRFYRNLEAVLEKDPELKARIGHRGRRIYIAKCRTAIAVIVQSDLPASEKLSQIDRILSNDDLHDCLVKYPINKYKPYLRMVANEMKHRRSSAVFLMFKVRKIARKNKIK